MKRALVAVVLLALTSQATADNRDAWQATFAGSVTVAIGGVIAWRHGVNKVDEAEDALCAGGAYAECYMTVADPISQEEVDRLNAKGNRGARISYIGFGTAVVGVGLAGISLYKGFLAPRRNERAVVVAPTVSKDGAGAALSFRW
jgi:hypothetical protein